jgi:FkbM family methyltransferase
MGPPNSGVAVLCQCLRIVGLQSADEKSPIGAANINRLLCQDLKHSPTMAGPLPIDWIDTLEANTARQRISSLSSNLLNSKTPYFMGDSLLCRFWPLWTKVFQEAGHQSKFILIVRHPWEVAQSISHYQNIGMAQAIIIWFTYLRDAMRVCQNMECVLVTFDQLLADPIATLTLIGTEFGFKFPKTPFSKASSLLDFVNPKLKIYNASDLSANFKLKYHYFGQLYSELRCGQTTKMLQYFNGSICSTAVAKPSVPTIKNFSHERSSSTSEPNLIDCILEVIGKYEKQTAKRNTIKHASGIEAGPKLFAQLSFSSVKECIEGVATIPLSANGWQLVSLAVLEKHSRYNGQIYLNPLNVKGTVVIGSLQFVDPSSRKIILELQTPQDFDRLELSGTALRIPDLKNLIIVVTGDKACLRIPFNNLSDHQVRIDAWIRVSRDQQVLHRLTANRQKRIKSGSNIIWLSSYPRSGNTLLRIILNYNFGLKSYSIYNDNNDIGKHIEISDIVGHQFMNWSIFFDEQSTLNLKPEDFHKLDPMRYRTNDLKLIKTHSHYHDGFTNDKVIYIYRDGRSTLRSYASYKENFVKGNVELQKLLDILVTCGDDLFGNWGDHALSWMEHPSEKLLMLKFEDVITDYNEALNKIASFLEIAPIRTDRISFERLHSINSNFFRKGKKSSWQDLFDDTRHALFWIMNHQTMSLLNYDSCRHPIYEAFEVGFWKNFQRSIKQNNVAKSLYELNHYLQECATLIEKNISGISDVNRLIIGKRLKKTYLKFIDIFKLYSSSEDIYGWGKKWCDLLSNKIFSYNLGNSKIHLFDNGVRVYDHHLISIQRKRYKKINVHESEEEALFIKIVKSIPPDGTFVNIGSAIGYYPILAKTIAPGLKIYAIEPIEKHRKYFIQNIVLNGFKEDDFVLYNEAISAYTGHSKFVDSGYGSHILSNTHNNKSALEVKTITLGDLIDRINRDVDLLQMDVQGSEMDILWSAQKTLNDHRIKTFVIGTHSKKLHENCASILKRYGYSIIFSLFDTIDQPDGILVAGND